MNFLVRIAFTFVAFLQLSDNPRAEEDTSNEENQNIWNYQRFQPASLCDNFKTCEPLFVISSHIDRFVRGRQPAVLAANNTAHWSARKWDLRLWAHISWPVLYDVIETQSSMSATVKKEGLQSGNNPTTIPNVFMIYDTNDEPGENFQRYELIDELVLQDFLQDVFSNHSVSRFYSTNYRVLEGIVGLENDTTWRSFILQEANIDSNISQSIAPSFNLLYPQSAIQSRYSEYHTMRVQLQGTTAIYLFPPSKVIQSLSLFPFFHPSSYQSPFHLYKDDMSSVQALYHVLQPGETVYIPPGYMIYTEANSTSMFLDILSISSEQNSYLEALSIEFPWGKRNLTHLQRVVYTQVFLVHVLSRIHGVTTVYQYARKLYKARYQLFYPMESVQVQNHEFTCYRHGEEAVQYDDLIRKINREEIEKIAEFTAKKFNDLNKVASKEMKWILLGNYVEQIIGWAYQGGSLMNLALFLKECLDMKSKIEIIEEVEGPSIVKMDPQEL